MEALLPQVESIVKAVQRSIERWPASDDVGQTVIQS